MVSLEEFKKAPSIDVHEFVDDEFYDGPVYHKNRDLTKAWQKMFVDVVRAVYCVNEYAAKSVTKRGVEIGCHRHYILTTKGLLCAWGSEWGGVEQA